MSHAILEYLAEGKDLGISSRAIAFAALRGKASKNSAYPHDGGDFGRCYRLLQKVPEARLGLDILATTNPVWKAITERWSEIEAAYLHDKPLLEKDGWRATGLRCYDLMQTIIRPVENVEVTFRATKEQIKAIAEKLFEETEFGVLVEMASADG